MSIVKSAECARDNHNHCNGFAHFNLDVQNSLPCGCSCHEWKGLEMSEPSQNYPIENIGLKSISEQYQKDAVVTDLMDYNPVRDRVIIPDTIRLLHAGMGLTTEAGEFMDMLKKHILYGRELDLVNLAEEIGDMFWYAALACDTLGVSFEEIMEKNIAKLKARYGDKFTEAAALNRNLNVERRILEG